MPSLRRHYSFTLGANIAILLLGVVSSVLAARLLGPEQRGELAVIVLWPTALWVLGSLGMHQAITFFCAQHPQRRGAVLTASIVLAVAQSAVLLAIGVLLLPTLLQSHRPEVIRLSQVFLLSIPLSLFSGYLLSILQGAMHLAAYNLSRIFLAAWYATVVAALYALNRPDLETIVTWQLAGYGVATLLNAILVHFQLNLRWLWDPSIFKPLLSYGVKTQLWNASYHLNQRLDQLVMSIWLAPEALGMYVVALALANPLAIIPNAIGAVTLPAAAREPGAVARSVIRESVRTTMALLLAAGSALFVAVPYLLPLFFGSAFQPAVAACRLLVVAMIPLGLSLVLYESLRALNRPLVPAFAELTAMALTIILLYVLLPRYGYLGAALASLGAYTAACVIALWFTRFELGLRSLRTLQPGDTAP